MYYLWLYPHLLSVIVVFVFMAIVIALLVGCVQCKRKEENRGRQGNELIPLNNAAQADDQAEAQVNLESVHQALAKCKRHVESIESASSSSAVQSPVDQQLPSAPNPEIALDVQIESEAISPPPNVVAEEALVPNIPDNIEINERAAVRQYTPEVDHLRVPSVNKPLKRHSLSPDSAKGGMVGSRSSGSIPSAHSMQSSNSESALNSHSSGSSGLSRKNAVKRRSGSRSRTSSASTNDLTRNLSHQTLSTAGSDVQRSAESSEVDTAKDTAPLLTASASCTENVLVDGATEVDKKDEKTSENSQESLAASDGSKSSDISSNPSTKIAENVPEKTCKQESLEDEEAEDTEDTEDSFKQKSAD